MQSVYKVYIMSGDRLSMASARGRRNESVMKIVGRRLVAKGVIAPRPQRSRPHTRRSAVCAKAWHHERTRRVDTRLIGRPESSRRQIRCVIALPWIRSFGRLLRFGFERRRLAGAETRNKHSDLRCKGRGRLWTATAGRTPRRSALGPNTGAAASSPDLTHSPVADDADAIQEAPG